MAGTRYYNTRGSYFLSTKRRDMSHDTTSTQPDVDTAMSGDDDDSDRKVYDIPGGVTVTDKGGGRDLEPVAAKCPFCDFTAPLGEGGERLVRVHITRESDAAHEHRNGFMPEIHVHLISDSGEFVEDISGEESSVKKDGEITTEMMPSGLTDRQEAVIKKAVLKPHLSTAEIQRELEDEMGEEDAPSYHYVWETLNKYVRRPEVEDADEDDEFVGYDDLTEPRQRLVDEIMKEPVDDDPTDPDQWNRSMTAVHEAAESSFGTLQKLLDENADLIEHRYARIHSGAWDPPHEAEEGEHEPPESPEEWEDAKESVVLDAEVVPIEEEPEPERFLKPTYDPETEYVVQKETLRQFGDTIETLEQAAEEQQDAAPRDSPMEVNAQGRLDMISRVREFMTRLAEEGQERAPSEEDSEE